MYSRERSRKEATATSSPGPFRPGQPGADPGPRRRRRGGSPRRVQGARGRGAPRRGGAERRARARLRGEGPSSAAPAGGGGGRPRRGRAAGGASLPGEGAVDPRPPCRPHGLPGAPRAPAGRGGRGRERERYGAARPPRRRVGLTLDRRAATRTRRALGLFPRRLARPAADAPSWGARQGASRRTGAPPAPVASGSESLSNSYNCINKKEQTNSTTEDTKIKSSIQVFRGRNVLLRKQYPFYYMRFCIIIPAMLLLYV